MPCSLETPCSPIRLVIETESFLLLECRINGHSFRVEKPAPDPGRYREFWDKTRRPRSTPPALPIIPKQPGCRFCKQSHFTACFRHGGPSTEVRQREMARQWRERQKKAAS